MFPTLSWTTVYGWLRHASFVCYKSLSQHIHSAQFNHWAAASLCLKHYIEFYGGRRQMRCISKTLQYNRHTLQEKIAAIIEKKYKIKHCKYQNIHSKFTPQQNGSSPGHLGYSTWGTDHFLLFISDLFYGFVRFCLCFFCVATLKTLKVKKEGLKMEKEVNW